ncbi:hypothetical protein BV22DRAFT_1119664 [Leucogyrophana mollusca]|uniref:Uncharacterized protein n=1 Tax=Leucogyrophana mollusca TaxID=85980 RepID=A0ACB8BK98_9AGAM|nr:hypothetical protein BV22DRAFT_1119664 [Leucogyrophana mollusca]
MSASPAAIVQELITAGYDMQLVRYLGGVSAAILIHDYLLTFDHEVTYIWRGPWSLVKIIYLFSRYMPFIDTPLVIVFRDFLSGLSNDTCHTMLGLISWLYVAGMTLTELILVIRTWAVWGRNKWIALVLFIHSITSFVVVSYSTYQYVKSLKFTVMPEFHGCFGIAASSILMVNWALFMVMESIYLSLMLINVYIVYKRDQNITELYKVLLHDGVAYFAILFVLSALNLIIVTTQTELSSLLATPVRVIHSVLAARMVLHIREMGSRTTHGDAFTMATMRSMNFAPREYPDTRLDDSDAPWEQIDSSA